MFSAKVLFFLGALLVVTSALPANDTPNVVGGPRALTDEELKEEQTSLQTTLTKLAAGEGPEYKLTKINSGTRQVVSGSLTKLDCVLVDKDGNSNDCIVEIWSQPWLENGTQVTFDCKGAEKVVKKF